MLYSVLFYKNGYTAIFIYLIMEMFEIFIDLIILA